MRPPNTVTPFAERSEFDQAVDHVRTAGAAYHDGTGLVLADGEYDQLVARIAATEQLHPDWNGRGVTTDIAPGAAAGAVRHTTPMLSLDKITTKAEVAQFVESLNGSTVVVEAKFDGMACHLDYAEGRLVRAVTRGDGTAGEDITHQVTREPGIAGLPRTLPHPWTGSVRGEIYMTAVDFEQANTARTASGKPAFANPRGAVAGSIRKVGRRYTVPMSFAAYAITGDELQPIDSHLERMGYARLLGITTATMLTMGALPAGTLIHGTRIEDVQLAIDAVGELRPQLGYPVDGAVIKVDSRRVRTGMGSHSSAPRWAKAFKFPPDTAFSTLHDIEVSVGRTGRAGFTAIIEPVPVNGTTIRRASLHNVAWIEQQGLGVGSRVAVMRAGDVIPRITAVVGERPDGVAPWQPPMTCPQCDQPWDRGGQLWRCVTPACSLVSLLTYAASRDVWDIDGLGEEIAAALVAAELVGDLADLFVLTAQQIAVVPYFRAARTSEAGAVRRIGMATAQKLVAGIDAAKEKPLARHITALGIRMTGRRMGRTLASHFRTLEALRAATVDDLAGVDGIGPEKARTIFEGLAEQSKVIGCLVAAGITTTAENLDAPADASRPLAGKTVVVTGAVPGMNRTEAQEAAERLGATVSGSVSAKTDILIVGTGTSARSKLAKAEQLNVTTMAAETFVGMSRDFSGGTPS
ncbi:NAD-dependent DNA ligase LigA [Amycolatopsis sp. cmx-4-61]|uniref:NAD-dependent DNA ligase LigA n=1 Tax=Amycolatopsis sp. cmx-4-61 TaxID=2790937 RepID=UPI00397A4EE4